MHSNDLRGVSDVDWPLKGGSRGGDRDIFCWSGDCGWPQDSGPEVFLCVALVIESLTSL